MHHFQRSEALFNRNFLLSIISLMIFFLFAIPRFSFSKWTSLQFFSSSTDLYLQIFVDIYTSFLLCLFFLHIFLSFYLFPCFSFPFCVSISPKTINRKTTAKTHFHQWEIIASVQKCAINNHISKPGWMYHPRNNLLMVAHLYIQM